MLQIDRRSCLPLLAAGCLVLVAPAGFAESAPGITDTSIKLGTSASISGPAAAVGMVTAGIELKFKAVNADGGVTMGDGKTRKIDFVIADDAGEPPRTVANTRRLAEQSGVFAFVGVPGTAQNQAIRQYINQRQIPNIFVYASVYEFGDEARNPWVITGMPSFTTEAAIYAEYLKQVRPEAKVSALYINTDFGANFMAGFKAGIAGSKITIVGTQACGAADPTVDTQMTNLKASGADTLLIATAPKQGTQAIRFAGESGWKPLTMITFAASSKVSLAPAGLQNMQGIITGQFLKPIESPAYAQDPGVKAYDADYDRFKPRFQRGDTLGQMGYTIGEATIHVLQTMKQPTRQAMMDAARNMDGVTASLLLPGITMTTKAGVDGFPIESMQLFRFTGDNYQPIGSVISYEGRTPRIGTK
jgi:ABC-type branched-subunit amino acid transport system substrate-binding protein